MRNKNTNIKTNIFPPPSPRLSFTPSLLTRLPTPSGAGVMEGYGQSRTVPSCCSSVFPVFPLHPFPLLLHGSMLHGSRFSSGNTYLLQCGVLQGLQWGQLLCCGAPPTPNTDDNAVHSNEVGTRISSEACAQFGAVFFP